MHEVICISCRTTVEDNRITEGNHYKIDFSRVYGNGGSWYAPVYSMSNEYIGNYSLEHFESIA